MSNDKVVDAGVVRLKIRAAKVHNLAPGLTIRVCFSENVDVLHATMNAVSKVQFDKAGAQKLWAKNAAGFATIKSVAKHVKAKLTLLADPRTSMRDPRFAERAREFKLRLREATARVEATTIARNVAVRQFQTILQERDVALSALDPNYESSTMTDDAWSQAVFGFDGGAGGEAQPDSSECELDFQM